MIEGQTPEQVDGGYWYVVRAGDMPAPPTEDSGVVPYRMSVWPVDVDGDSFLLIRSIDPLLAIPESSVAPSEIFGIGGCPRSRLGGR